METKYPVYDKDDLMFSIKDGDFRISDFHDFLEKLQEQHLLETKEEIGIVAFAKENGTASLSPKQSFVLNRISLREG